jgi:8-oxo-dGTP diphosphatase
LNEPVARIGVGTLVFNDRGQILVGRRTSAFAHGQYSYGWTGGHLEFGETPVEAACREAREEAGIEIGDLRLLCVNNIVRYDKHYIDIEFVGRIVGGEPRVLQPHEMDSWTWYDLDAVPLPLFEPARLALEAYRNGALSNFGVPLFSKDSES